MTEKQLDMGQINAVLAVENARLREALRPFADALKAAENRYLEMYDIMPEPSSPIGKDAAAILNCGHLRAARAALNGRQSSSASIELMLKTFHDLMAAYDMEWGEQLSDEYKRDAEAAMRAAVCALGSRILEAASHDLV